MTSDLRLKTKDNVFNGFDFGKMLLNHGFDAVFQGHFGMRARAAMALQFHFHNVVGSEFNEFHIATIGLEVRTHLVKNGDDFLF